jgi:hypothetical protein
MNLQYKNVAKKSLQLKEGHLPLIPYCSKHRSKHLFAFRMFFDCASRYVYVIKTNLMHYLPSVYFVSQPLHVSGIFVAHHTIGMCCASQSTVCWRGWPTGSQLKSPTHTNCCVCTVYLLMMGYKYAQNMQRLNDDITYLLTYSMEQSPS